MLGDLLATAGVIVAGMRDQGNGLALAAPYERCSRPHHYPGRRPGDQGITLDIPRADPLGFNAADISKTICGMEHVLGVHDVHLWSIGHGVPAFSAHVLLNDRKISETDTIRREIEEKLSGSG